MLQQDVVCEKSGCKTILFFCCCWMAGWRWKNGKIFVVIQDRMRGKRERRKRVKYKERCPILLTFSAASVATDACVDGVDEMLITWEWDGWDCASLVLAVQAEEMERKEEEGCEVERKRRRESQLKSAVADFAEADSAPSSTTPGASAAAESFFCC